jgi:hypothetical protein
MGRRFGGTTTVDQVLRELRRRDFLHPDVRVVCQRLSRDRGRPLHLIPLPLRTSISGAWLGMPDADYIVYQSVGSSPLHQIHVIWHEIGHMLLPGHARTCDVDPATRDVLMKVLNALVPNLSPAVLSRILGRGGFTDQQEVEAEVFAGAAVRALGEPAPNSGHRNLTEAEAQIVDALVQELRV